MRLCSGNVSQALRAEFDHWRQQSAAHEQAYQETTQLCQQLSGPLQADRQFAAAQQRRNLKRGQQIAFHTVNLGTVQPADVNSAEAWRHGRLLMNFLPLKQAIAEINLYRRGQIRLVVDKLGEKEVNIAVYIQHIDAWLEALERTMGVKVERLGNEVFNGPRSLFF